MAFLLGLTGSLHCVGMCGPIALALPVHGFSPFRKWLALAAYNAGRILTYGLLGILLGAAGTAIPVPYWQKPFSIVAGLLLLAAVSVSVRAPEKFDGPSFLRTAVYGLQKKMQGLLRKRALRAIAALGFLNGLLPCGMVYVALLTAMAGEGPAAGGLYMVVYGLGTVPAMMATGWAGQWASLRMRRYFRKAFPVVVALAGVLLIARGILAPAGIRMPAHNGPIPLCTGR